MTKMLAYFPIPYPDELFYSIIARYGDTMQYGSHSALFKDLFGVNKTVPTLFAHRLQHLVEILPLGHTYTVERFINDHTLLPFTAPFLAPERVEKLREAMAGVEQAGPITAIAAGLHNDQIKLSDALRFCPRCVEEERDRLGEAYWHRLHQLSGVEICLKHLVWLEKSRVLLFKQSVPVSAESAIAPVPARPADPSSPNVQAYLFIAREFAWLGGQRKLAIDPVEMRQRYVAALIGRGLATYGGSPLIDKIVQAVNAHFSPAFLRRLNSALDREGVKWHWALRLLRKTSQARTPLHHLLLLHFLGYRLKEFLLQPAAWRPFGKGPWPCFNPAADHYRQPVAEEMKLAYRKEDGRLTGVFRCNCGFIYTRRGPDKTPQDRFRRERIIRYGPVWEKKLVELWLKPELSLSDIVKRLASKESIVRRQARRLNLRIKRGRRWREGEWELQLAAEEEEMAYLRRRHRYRVEWLEALRDDERLGAGALVKKYTRVYSWLYNNDLEWLLARKAPRLDSLRPKPARVDWEIRDRELPAAVREEAARIRRREAPFQRVTKSAIFKNLGRVSQLFQLDNLPLTRKALAEVTESGEAYALRRLWRVAEMYCAEGELPTPKQLYRRAGISSSQKKPVVAAALEDALALLARLDCEAIQGQLPPDWGY